MKPILYFWVLSSFFLCIPMHHKAQILSDKALLKGVSFEKKEYDSRKVIYGFTQGKKTINPLYHLLSVSMFLYQNSISPQLSRDCAFSPSCSEYGKELIKEFGLVKGAFCTSDRLMRCNRISLAGKPLFYFDTPDHKIHESTDYYLLHHSK